MNGRAASHGAVTTMELLLANHRRFLSFLESRVDNRHDAEDILQAAFVRTAQKTEEGDEPDHVIAWFYRLLRNAVVDHYRRVAAGDRARDAYAHQAAQSDSASDEEIERVVCECVNDLIRVLKPEYAAIIRDIDLNGGDLTTTAESYGITPGNARTRLHRARRALRIELEQTCRTCATHGCLDCTCSSTKRQVSVDDGRKD